MIFEFFWPTFPFFEDQCVIIKGLAGKGYKNRHRLHLCLLYNKINEFFIKYTKVIIFTIFSQYFLTNSTVLFKEFWKIFRVMTVQRGNKQAEFLGSVSLRANGRKAGF